MKKRISLLLAGAMLLALAACGGNSDPTPTPEAENTTPAIESNDGVVKGTGETLTIYTNSGSDGRGEWLVERAAQDGFKVQFIEAGAAEIQNRLLAEASAPVADVVFGLNGIIWANLKANDITTPYVPVWADEVDPALNDADGHYHAIVKQAILLAYDKNQISEADAPKDWTDLPTKFAGKYEYESKLTGGTTRNVIAGILTRYVDPNGDLGISDEGWQVIADFYKNGVPDDSEVDLYGQIANPDSPVLMGQMWSSGVADRDAQYGTVTGYAIPEVGVPYAVEGVAIVNGTKHMEEAKRFVDWFGSATVQGDWCEKFATLPANVGAVDKANDFNKVIAQLPAQAIDWDLTAANIDAWCEKIMLQYMP